MTAMPSSISWPGAPAALVPLHVDAHLLVLEKPAGLLCVPGRGADKQDCLSARAMTQWPDARVVHRLDMATSGLVLMARSAGVQRALGDAFARREIGKRYQAIVDGLVPDDRDAAGAWSVIDAPIAPDWPRRPMQIVDAAGKPSLTRWRVIETLPTLGASRLLLEPCTGRTHQLRVHLASIGHAILGDTLYASDEACARSTRLLLHASTLRFRHPATGEALRFESAPPF